MLYIKHVVANISTVYLQDDCYIEVDKLTDEIVEDIIYRVVDCADCVQTVFLEQGLVHWCYLWAFVYK